MSTGFKLDADKLIDGFAGFESKAEAAIKMYAENGALALQNSARENARWTDRTGHARQRLTGDSLPVVDGYKLRLAHGVDYGKWLELAHERKYAIIEETIQKVGIQEIMPGFENLIGKLKGGGQSG